MLRKSAYVWILSPLALLCRLRPCWGGQDVTSNLSVAAS